MNGIGGNINAVIQTYVITVNDIGEQVKQWNDVQTLFGWLDMLGGDSDYSNFGAKVQASTHVFVCDFCELDTRIKPETARLVCDGKTFDITMIDNPMNMRDESQLEIMLKFTGGV